MPKKHAGNISKGLAASVCRFCSTEFKWHFSGCSTLRRLALPHSCIGNDLKDFWLWCLLSPTLYSPPPFDVSVSTSKLISVIKLYRKVMVLFLVLQTEDLAALFLCRYTWQAILAAQWFHTWLMEIGNHIFKQRYCLLLFLNAVRYSATWCEFQTPSPLTVHTNPVNTTCGCLDLLVEISVS